jgi:hypothetical protein
VHSVFHVGIRKVLGTAPLNTLQWRLPALSGCRGNDFQKLRIAQGLQFEQGDVRVA